MKNIILTLLFCVLSLGTIKSQNVGISDNTAFNPSYMLHLQPSAAYGNDLFSVQNNAGTTYFHVKLNGNVGIGINNPQHPLDLQWSISGNRIVRLWNTSSAAGSNGLLISTNAGDAGSYILNCYSNSSSKMFVRSDGNVGIGTNNPDASAILHIASTNKGVLLPRFGLSSTNNNAPIGTWLDGLTVFNTATAGVAPNNVLPGYYYMYNSKWERLGGNQVVTAVYTTESNADVCINNVAWSIYSGTSLTLSLTAGQKVLAWAQGGLMTDDNCDGTADVSRVIVDTRISVNNADFVNGAWVRTSLDNSVGYIMFTAVSIVGQYTVPANGNYTFQVETRRAGGGVGDNAIGGGNNLSSLQMTMIVVVLQ